MEQLDFRHFNTNSKIFFETVIFFHKEAKAAPKGPILFCLVYQGVFGHFTTIPDYFRRSPKTTIPEDCRRFPRTKTEDRPLPKMSEEPSKQLTIRIFFENSKNKKIGLCNSKHLNIMGK